MAKKKEDKKQDVKQPQTNNGDAAAADLFGNSWLSPVGTPSFSRGIPAQQELLPSSQLSTPTIPSFPSPLIRTNYGLPPSERPDWRDPAMQWDARPVVPRTVEPFRGNASTEAAKKYEGLPSRLQTFVDRLNMSPQTTSVVDTARSPLSGINAPIDTSVQGMDVNRSPIATRVPEMPSSLSAAPSFDLSGATQQTTPLLTNQVPEMPVNVAQAKVPIKTPYGTIYATAEQAAKPRVAEIANLPANSARLERIGEEARRNVALQKARQAGRAIGRANVENMENYFQQKRAERVALREASEEARRSGVGSQAIREARAAYTSRQPSSVAGIRRDYARMVPNFNRPMRERTAFVREPFNIPNQNQPMEGSNFASSGLPYTDSVYQNPFSLNFGLGY